MTLKTIFTSFFLSLSLLSLGQKTAALNEPERSYKSAVELYNKQLYNQAINLFNDVQADIIEPNTQAEIAYYIASSKLYLKHQNALNVMLEFQNKYPNHFRIHHSHLELGDYYFEQNQIKPALQSYKKIDMRVQAVDVPNQEAITKDNISVGVNAVIYYRVQNAAKSFLN